MAPRWVRMLAAGLALAALALVRARAAEAWPQFRGPDSSGVAADDPRLPESWSTDRNVAWKTDIPGLGWSSPVVWGNRVFLTTAQDTGAEAPRPGLYLGGERPVSARTCRWLVLCLDLDSGAVLWTQTAHEGVPPQPKHVKNSHATETPVTDGERVYAYFGNVGLFAYGLDGTPVWTRKWDPVPVRAGWGTAASPVLHGDRLYVVNDNDVHSWLAAVDTRTGNVAWCIDRNEKSNWSTPFVWRNSKRTEIVTTGTGRTRSYSLDGTLLWELSGASSITIPTPVAAHGLLFVSSGFIMSPRQPLYAIRPGGAGDLTLKPDQTESETIAWSRPKGAAYNPSPLVYGDHLYVLLDRGTLSCYDARTGDVLYEKQRLPSGDAYTASPWGCNGRVYCLGENGDTHVVQAGPTFRVLASSSLGGMCLACPAVADGSFLLRTANRLYRLQNRSAPGG